MKLLGSNTLASIIIITFAAVIIFPLYIIFYIEPSFNQFIIDNTEIEAAKLAKHLTNTYFEDSSTLNKESLTSDILQNFDKVQSDFHIIKIKIFDTKGEIIHSTDKKDIGTLNKHEYFHTIVAKGNLFSKVVHKNKISLEGKTMPIDVVEVYVPVMHGSSFTGAFEIYYDITATGAELSGLINKMTQSTLLISLFLLGAVIWASLQASKNNKAKEQAEEDLQNAYESLEAMVVERTKELTEVNKTLGNEIAIRKETEKDKEKLIAELRDALDKVKTLSGLLPICSSCQQIRDDEGNWSKVDTYIQTRTDAEFTHGICPNCAKRLYPELYDDIKESYTTK